jgi:hypothetical protein
MMGDRDPLRESRNTCGDETVTDQQGKAKWVF